MKTIGLSVIIVAYKSRHEIGACLDSLPAALNGCPLEVIVVDNFPGDGTGALVRDNYPHVRYIDPGANLGFGRANNLGYAQSRGEFILFLNPDTVVNEPALRHCLARLEADASIGLISPRLMQADGTMDLACRRSVPSLWDGFCRASGLAAKFPNRAIFSGYNLTHLPPDETYEVGMINGAFMLGRRTTFESVADPASPAIFDEHFFMYGDDIDLCIRVGLLPRRIVYDGSVSIVHLKGTSVAKELQPMSQAIFDANRDVFLKHFNPQNSRLVRWKWQAAFALWKLLARTRGRLRGHRAVKPL